MTVLLTDIDNTLYDWAAFFAPSFRAMIHALARAMAIPEEQLYQEAKRVFENRRSLEYAFLIQELESVKTMEVERQREIIAMGRGAFRSVQRKRLAPYFGVRQTLEWLRRQDIIVIGVTNAPVYRAQHRLFDLGLDSLLNGIVAWEGFEAEPENPAASGFLRKGRIRSRTRLKPDWIWTVSEKDCKPNETHYQCAIEAIRANVDDVWALGDSLVKDLEPAAKLGIKTIWARYGAGFDPTDIDNATLLRITHWSQARIHSTYHDSKFRPDKIVDSFEDITSIIPAKYPMLF